MFAKMVLQTVDSTRIYRTAMKRSSHAANLLPFTCLNPSVRLRESVKLGSKYYFSNHKSDELVMRVEQAMRENTMRLQYSEKLVAKHCVPYTMRCQGASQVSQPASIR